MREWVAVMRWRPLDKRKNIESFSKSVYQIVNYFTAEYSILLEKHMLCPTCVRCDGEHLLSTSLLLSNKSLCDEKRRRRGFQFLVLHSTDTSLFHTTPQQWP